MKSSRTKLHDDVLNVKSFSALDVLEILEAVMKIRGRGLHLLTRGDDSTGSVFRRDSVCSRQMVTCRGTMCRHLLMLRDIRVFAAL